MIKVGVVGAAGYAGLGILKILHNHPLVQVVWISSEESHAGKKLSDIRPSFGKIFNLECSGPDITSLIPSVDVIFLALPNGLAMKLAPAILSFGKKAIDISADFRIKDLDEYKSWYKIDHLSPDLVPDAVYGLPEINKDKIIDASLIANPGCYPTASLLGSLPLVKFGLINPDSIIIDAKSGVSGAGSALTDITHFPECNENVRAYAVASHRHNPEIDQILSEVADQKICTTFTPHLIPMNRGIHATIYANLSNEKSSQEIIAIYKDFYKDAEFVRILENGKLPATKYVSGSNYCDIGIIVDKRTNRVIVLSVIDNLIKGAAGQAVQNMNLMFKIDEKMALDNIPLYP